MVVGRNGELKWRRERPQGVGAAETRKPYWVSARREESFSSFQEARDPGERAQRAF